MDETKIVELVVCIKDKLAKAFEVDVAEIRNIPPKQLFEKLKGCDPEFTQLYDAIKRSVKEMISNRAPFPYDADDVWQNFVMQKLPKVISTFDNENFQSFIAYLRRPITLFCMDEYRRIYKTRSTSKPKIINPEKIIPVDAEKEDVPDSSPSNPIDRIFLMERLKVILPYLDDFRHEEEKKLAYHCKKILGEILNYDYYILFKKWRGSSLETVTSLIEKAYSQAFDKETEFMKKIDHKIKERGIIEKIFLEDVDIDTPKGKQKISDWVREIGDAFKRNKKKIFDSF